MRGKHKSYTPEQVAAALESAGTLRGAARLLGCAPNNVRQWLDSGKLDATEVPDRELDAETLLARKAQKFERIQAHEEAAALRVVRVRESLPIGIMHFGDPHLDDDGSDTGLLERHVALVQETDGLYGATVGDMTNNWTGRLGRLYSNQSTTAREAWILVEWLMHAVPWLYVIGGNHDVWSGAGDPLTWLAQSATFGYTPHGCRIALRFPGGREVRVNARHDFRGHSMWNPAHGVARAAQMGWRDHLLMAGHKHVSGYNVLRHPDAATGIGGGLVSHCVRVATYKVYDDYATAQGLPNQSLGPCCVTVINPQATNELNLVHVFWEPFEAAEYLTWLRKKAA